MKKEQILKKAIEKAVKNGYDVELSGNGNVKIFNGKEKAERIISPIEFIFSHDFARAFWGEEILWIRTDKTKILTRIIVDKLRSHKFVIPIKAWIFHQMMMVLEKDPIKYLEKFI